MARSTKASEKQKRILEYIKECLLSRGYPPTVREICEGKTAGDKPYQWFGGTVSRREVVNVPLIGTVAAGAPILAEENIENYFPIPAEMLPNKQTFMLKVKGDSMIDVGIYNGDRVIVEQAETAANGEIVVALVDDSATVKRFFKEKGHYRLQPENPDMDPIIVDHVQILGKVIGLLRLMK